jgi:hypothetical protein
MKGNPPKVRAMPLIPRFKDNKRTGTLEFDRHDDLAEAYQTLGDRWHVLARSRVRDGLHVRLASRRNYPAQGATISRREPWGSGMDPHSRTPKLQNGIGRYEEYEALLLYFFEGEMPQLCRNSVLSTRDYDEAFALLSSSRIRKRCFDVCLQRRQYRTPDSPSASPSDILGGGNFRYSL